MKTGALSRFNHLRHVRGARIDFRWTIYHVRTSTVGREPSLARPGCAEIFIQDLFHYRAELDFKLSAFVVMPEHVHLLLMPTEAAGLSKIMMLLKRHSAWAINRYLGRKGPFWRDEFFDHWEGKPEQIAEAIEYLHNNPVRRGLVANPKEYPYSSYLAWTRPELSPYQVDRECFW